MIQLAGDAGEADADKTVAGEWELLTCMFRTLIADARSTDGVVRASVDRFLREGGPEWWGDLLGLGDAFATALRRTPAIPTFPRI